MIKYLSNRKKDVIVILVLLLIVFAFFSRLFYPTTSLFITPEYNGSDTTNFNIPVKLILSNAYKSGEIPLWEKNIGTGFPLLAETQIGYFYLPNIILYSLFSFPIAFNLGYVVSFSLSIIGMYVFLRYKKFPEVISMFAAFIFAFSGFYVGHMNHYNMLQSASLLPWLMLLFEWIRQKPTIGKLLIFSFILSQQIFAGYAQITFITLCSIVGFYILDLALPLKSAKKNIKLVMRDTALLGLCTAVAVSMSAVMLLPTLNLTEAVARPENYDVQHATYFSFPIKQFLGFVNPFIFGSPKFGTFPPPEQYDGTFFWETAQYIGLIPFFFIIIYCIRNFKSRKVILLGIFVLGFAILMLGKFSPAYFVYSLPPLNRFRVPSRFILPVIFGMSILFAYSLRSFKKFMQDKYPKRKAELVVIALFLITLTEIFYYWYSYHPMANAQEWLQNPSFAEYIKKDKIQGRVMTPRGGVDRADIYRKHGWDKAEDFYVFSRNEMLPNLSTTWGIPQLQAYTGLSNLKRHNLFEAVLEFTSVNLNKTRPDVLLDMAHVGYVIVSNKEDQPFKNMKLVKQIESHKKYDKSLLLYENPHVVPRARVVTQYHVVKTTNDLVNKFLTMDESLLQTVLLEEKVSIKSQESAEQAKVTWLADRNQYIQLEVDAPTDGILVLADMYEENWKAYDNGKEVKILPANLIQRAIVLPKGKHEVEFKYEPQSFYKGRNISIASHIIVLAGLAYFGAQSWRASRPKR